MIIYVSLLIALIGLIVYVLSAQAKVMTLAIVAYGAGLLAFLLQIGGAHLGVLTR